MDLYKVLIIYSFLAAAAEVDDESDDELIKTKSKPKPQQVCAEAVTVLRRYQSAR